ncbi:MULTISPECIES: ArsA family ATPase [Actinoalloteichus]|uniref:Arsenite-activated ATPase ArsA n=1 Tax=Actinoalloteichus fjordicus TaxID=1612552 RepID=A0AAC9LD71_9PSEU|nr:MULTISPECIES: ArsA family ATPase [Actinoalloteichus]APU14174.1 arsenite-activated ATPase ArsA [Actinoalloteichus fjordicus]APU20120.1 arsenite-activated ATPase ArsA [Actinoalloteichus sp. GBA129-24]
MLLTRPITFFAGKGGVGKTTMAAAHALAAADAGHRTLVVSTDPAHSLGDAFETRLADRPRRIAEGLWAAEPDADAAVRRRVRQVEDDAAAALPRAIMPAVRRHLDHASAGPGMTESALIDLLTGYLAEVPAKWDRLIVDSAPTGHLLRMIALPSLLAPWIHGLTRRRERVVAADRFAEAVVGGPESEPDPLLERLHRRRRRLTEAADRLRDDAEVRLVLVPRRMVLAETERAADALDEGGFTLGRVVLNQIAVDADPVLLARIAQRFARPGIVRYGAASAEPTGFARLRELVARVPE